MSILFVSVQRTFDPSMTIGELEVWVESAWAISASKASRADRVVALYDGVPVGAWHLRGAYPLDDATYRVANGDTRPRCALALGEPLPVLPIYWDAAPQGLRRGVALVEDLDLTPPSPAEQRDDTSML